MKLCHRKIYFILLSLCLSLALLFQPLVSIANDQQRICIGQAFEAGKISRPKRVANYLKDLVKDSVYLGGYSYFYPLTMPIRNIWHIKRLFLNREPIRLVRMPLETMAGAYAWGIIYTLQSNALDDELVKPENSVVYEDFLAVANQKIDKNVQGRVIIIEAIPGGDELEGFMWKDFQERFNSEDQPRVPESQRPVGDIESGNATLVRARSLRELRQALIRMKNKYGSIAQVEILGHGDSGEIQIGNEYLSLANVDELKFDQMIAKDGQLRMISCALGSCKPLIGADGEQVVARLSQNLMPDGGQTLAAYKLIKVRVPEDPWKKEEPLKEYGLLDDLNFYIKNLGLANLRLSWKNLDLAMTHMKSDLLHIKVPARSSGDTASLEVITLVSQQLEPQQIPELRLVDLLEHYKIELREAEKLFNQEKDQYSPENIQAYNEYKKEIENLIKETEERIRLEKQKGK